MGMSIYRNILSIVEREKQKKGKSRKRNGWEVGILSRRKLKIEWKKKLKEEQMKR